MSTDFVQQFGLPVRQARESRGMSQEDLADAAGLHRTHISLIERGGRSARLETVAQLARALGVQPGELMPEIDLMP
jgi:transcriptional regulator with XRE-family HTH domain